MREPKPKKDKPKPAVAEQGEDDQEEDEEEDEETEEEKTDEEEATQPEAATKNSKEKKVCRHTRVCVCAIAGHDGGDGMPSDHLDILGLDMSSGQALRSCDAPLMG